MSSDVLKLFAKFGANGLIILVVWGCLATLVAVGAFPAKEDSVALTLKSFLQFGFSTVSLVSACMFITWNFFGWPSRLGYTDP